MATYLSSLERSFARYTLPKEPYPIFYSSRNWSPIIKLLIAIYKIIVKLLFFLTTNKYYDNYFLLI